MPLTLNDVEHWRRRAEEARGLAQQIADPKARRHMLNVADQYEMLATHAEARTAAKRNR
jgi:hypothetical protein